MTRPDERNPWWRIGTVVVTLVLRVAFRLRHRGVQIVPATGPAIVAANHVSALDGVVLAAAVSANRRRVTRYLAGAEFFGGRWFSWALRLTRQIPVRRGTGDPGALDEAIRTVRDGALSGIFPEGKVNPEPFGSLQRGKTGVARIALASRSPVVPVGIWGTQRRWPRDGLHWRRPLRPRVAVVFGPPLAPEGDVAVWDEVEAFTERVMAAIAEQVSEARTLAESR